MSRVIIPRSAIDLAVEKSAKPLREIAEPRLVSEFKKIKEGMLKEFDDHLVTRELKQKTNANPSAFTSYGSLFGFIGFDKNDEPTEIVRKMLETSELKFIKINKGGVVDFKAFYPSKEELFVATPLPWANGRSWLKGIESGISGLGSFLSLDDQDIDNLDVSRSGGGIQSESTLRSSRFKATKYISQILNNFIQKIDKLSL